MLKTVTSRPHQRIRNSEDRSRVLGEVWGEDSTDSPETTLQQPKTAPFYPPTGKNSGVPRPFHPRLSTEADSEEIELLTPRPRPSNQIFPAQGPKKNQRPQQAGGVEVTEASFGRIWILVTLGMSTRTFPGQIHLPVVPGLTCDPEGDLASEMPCGRCHTCTASRPCGSSHE